MTADIVQINGDAPRFRLGLLHDHRPPEVPGLGEFAVTVVPKPPANVAPIKTIWPMADNDRLGDCTVAGAVHVNQAGALITLEPWTYMGDGVVQDTYFGLSGGKDTGLLLPQVLKPWHMGVFLGQQPNGGYAVVPPKHTTQVKQSIWIFGNVYIAVDLPAIAQDQFKPDGSGVWELTHGPEDYDIEGGHCVVGVGYNAEGVYCVTWGSLVLATWEWWFTYVIQAYAVIPPAFKAKGGDGRGFDLTRIDRYLPKV
jgi:hypothetical protein